MADRLDKRLFVLLVLLAWVLVSPEGAGAQARPEEKVNIAVTGDITAIDAAARKITVKSTNDAGVVYDVESSATIMSGGKDIALDDLRVGWNVAINGHEVRGNRGVTFIKVVKAPAP